MRVVRDTDGNIATPSIAAASHHLLEPGVPFLLRGIVNAYFADRTLLMLFGDGDAPCLCLRKWSLFGTRWERLSHTSRLRQSGLVFSSRKSAYRKAVDVAESGTNDGRTIGYARVSRSEQDLQLQVDALRKHGVPAALLFTDKASGAKKDRSGLEACLAELREGDVLLVWRLDRLGRSVRHLVSLIDDLQTRGVGFRSICDGAIDTTSASGELVFHVFSALAQFERRLISERTMAGLAAARARGRLGGRPKLDPRDPRIATARTLHRDQSLSIAEICSTLRCSRSTLYRWLKSSTER